MVFSYVTEDVLHLYRLQDTEFLPVKDGRKGAVQKCSKHKEKLYNFISFLVGCHTIQKRKLGVLLLHIIFLFFAAAETNIIIYYYFITLSC